MGGPKTGIIWVAISTILRNFQGLAHGLIYPLPITKVAFYHSYSTARDWGPEAFPAESPPNV